MNLLTHLFTALLNAGLVRSAQAFSTEYLQRNPNWYAYQKHTGRDISSGAAIACVRCARAKLSIASITIAQASVLRQLQAELLDYLAQQHGIAEVCDFS